MGVMFESVLLFSLAVLIILVGLLVYYFKKRIVDVEQKNATCLELVQDVYSEHIKLRNQMMMVMSSHSQTPMHSLAPMHTPSHSAVPAHMMQSHEDNRIKIDLSEDEDDSDLDSDLDEDSDNDSVESDDEIEDKIKIVSVDLKFPEEFEVNIDEDANDEDGGGESELQSLDTTIEPVVVNKVGPADISKDELKKLTPTALKTLLVGKGVSADEISKMKKNELIQKLMSVN
jgi:hypothetical protein